MNYGPVIFLFAFFAVATSWFGMVLTPYVQLGQMQTTNTVPDKATYPLARAGFAREGLEVYRANGCAYCHSQQQRQTGVICDIGVTEAGTNQAEAIQALLKIKAAITEAEAQQILTSLPRKVRGDLSRQEADTIVKVLGAAGLKADMMIVPTGPDVARWGGRQSVAEDVLYDSPVMPGSVRVGPDLANVGARLQDPNWHLRHLYAPQSEVEGSLMPSYRFMFEKRRVTKGGTPDALKLNGKAAPEAGWEIVPKREANALVAYLLSLRADAPLFNAPIKLTMASAPAVTNAPATNAPAPPK
jgi:cbb3-type cytochrome oxidase cytochrome c subunit